MGFSSSHSPLRENRPNFQPFQIVSLKHKNASLYAEVVQVVEERQVCWARPLMLVTDLPETAIAGGGHDPERNDSKNLLDLRQGADLLLPTTLFQEALDTEVLPLLTQLNLNKANHSESESLNHNQRNLNQFIQQVCCTYSNFFL